MRPIFLLYLLLASIPVLGQKDGDSQMVISIDDTAGIYQKVKYALVNSDLMVKDNGNKDTVTTYSNEHDGIYCIVRAVIDAHTVTLTGAYGLKKMDDWGYTNAPKSYKPIIYFKGSKGWKLLRNVADRIGGPISYAK